MCSYSTFDGHGMMRLVQPELSAARQRDVREFAPRLRTDLAARNALLYQACNLGVDVVAHQIQLVMSLVFSRMHCHFAGRQRKDQPATPGINRLEAEDIAQKRPVGIGVLTVNDGMCAEDRRASA